jgi:hypothetical protein
MSGCGWVHEAQAHRRRERRSGRVGDVGAGAGRSRGADGSALLAEHDESRLVARHVLGATVTESEQIEVAE